MDVAQITLEKVGGAEHMVTTATLPCVIPGYHMSKKHWNTMILDGSLEEADFFNQPFLRPGGQESEEGRPPETGGARFVSLLLFPVIIRQLRASSSQRGIKSRLGKLLIQSKRLENRHQIHHHRHVLL